MKLRVDSTVSVRTIEILKAKIILRTVLILLFIQILESCQTLPVVESGIDAKTVTKHSYVLKEGQDVIGKNVQLETQEGDSLPVLARYFGLGFDEISHANSVIDPWVPEPDSKILLPLRFILPDAPRIGIVLNLAAKRLFYFQNQKNKTVTSFPVGIGREGWETPLGRTKIVSKKAHPAWRVPASVLTEHKLNGDPLPRVVPPGPENPLGEYALRLGISSYLIHGTNKPYGVGMEVSHGCIRLYPEDIKELFKMTPVGTKVKLIDQPYLIGWQGNVLYLQSFSTSNKSSRKNKLLHRQLKKKLQRLERAKGIAIDWNRVGEILAESNGIASPIFSPKPDSENIILVQHPSDTHYPIKNEPLTSDSWQLQVTKFEDEFMAKKMAVMLNHNGPPIPAQVKEIDSYFNVIAGPFKSYLEAETVAKRLKIDYEIQARLVSPIKK